MHEAAFAFEDIRFLLYKSIGQDIGQSPDRFTHIYHKKAKLPNGAVKQEWHLCAAGKPKVKVNVLMHSQKSSQSSQCNFHSCKPYSLRKEWIALSLWHSPPSSKGKNSNNTFTPPPTLLLLDVRNSSTACVYGLNQKSLKWRDWLCSDLSQTSNALDIHHSAATWHIQPLKCSLLCLFFGIQNNAFHSHTEILQPQSPG